MVSEGEDAKAWILGECEMPGYAWEGYRLVGIHDRCKGS
jgi:hypothetical protein